jgi:hypothetical protein
VVLSGRQKASVLVRLRGGKTYGKGERLLGFGGTVFKSIPIRAVHFAFCRNEGLVRPSTKHWVGKADCA